MKRFIALFASIAVLSQVPSVRADDFEQPPARSQSSNEGRQVGQHRWLGMTVGLVGGMILGGYAAAEIAVDNYDVGAFFGLWTAFAAGGAVAGYAATGGFSSQVDVALDQGRQSIRDARRLRQAAATPPPTLRLSALPGFDIDTMAAPESAVRLASID